VSSAGPRSPGGTDEARRRPPPGAGSSFGGARHLAAVALLFVGVTAVLHFSIRDPYRIYCEDIEHEFLPQKAYTYDHPWEAFAARPTPSCNFGASNYLTHGGPAAVLPVLTSLLARVAPRDPRGLALFEWRITSLYVLVSMAALFLFLRLIGADAALAAAVACSYPFAYTTFHEWRHADLTRGRLAIAPVLLGLLTATRFGGYRGWLFLALTVIACMGQASQFYWMAALVAYWMIATAWLERARLRAILRAEGARALRRLGPPLAALAVVATALGPMYLQVRAAMEGSALTAELTVHPERLLQYLEYGRNWFSLTGLLTVERGLLPWSVAGLCLWAGAALWARRRSPSRAPDPTSAATPFARLGLPLFVVALLLAFVPDLSAELLEVRDGRLEWAFAPVAAPVALAFLFHTTQRTWLVLAQIGALIAGVAAITSWIEDRRPARHRLGQLAAGLAVFVAMVGAATWLTSQPWAQPAQWRALAAVAAVLAAAHASAAPGRTRRLGQAALLALGVLLAARLSAFHYERGSRGCRRAGADAAALLARDQAVLARIPDQVRGLRQHRLFGEKWCYYLDASCALSYPLRTLPRDVLRFFAAAGAVDGVRLPYWMNLDYPFLIESGIAQMLGIRWWIVPDDVMANGGVLLAEAGAVGGLRLLEARNPFAKAWTLESWETAGSFEDAVARVVALGRAGELERRGVVQGPNEGPADLTRLDVARSGAADPAAPPLQEPGSDPRAASATPPAVEVLAVEPGQLRLRVRNPTPALLATNEFFHPDWTAQVDGDAVPVWRINAAFVGAVVPAGDHEVKLSR
jgi:hypothetical protein